MTRPIQERLNPGSEEAIRQGCICAIADNLHGKEAPFPPDGWWITQGCPVHAPTSLPEDDVEESGG